MTASLRDEQTTPFHGFPSSARATAVPNAFFAELLPLIDDADELRVTLYVIYALGRRKGYPRFVSENELAAESPLFAALGDGVSSVEPRARLTAALDAAVARRSLLRLDVEDEASKGTQALYFMNTPASARQIDAIRRGEVTLGRALPSQSEPPAARRENVFQLYEANIGPLTPLVAEELREAEQLYPHEWLEEALKEAALLNKRSWRYASAILRRWATEGRKRETAGRDPGEGSSARAQLLRRYRDLGG
jgi:DnaD/phage-associated family protein